MAMNFWALNRQELAILLRKLRVSARAGDGIAAFRIAIIHDPYSCVMPETLKKDLRLTLPKAHAHYQRALPKLEVMKSCGDQEAAGILELYECEVIVDK